LQGHTFVFVPSWWKLLRAICFCDNVRYAVVGTVEPR